MCQFFTQKQLAAGTEPIRHGTVNKKGERWRSISNHFVFCTLCHLVHCATQSKDKKGQTIGHNFYRKEQQRFFVIASLAARSLLWPFGCCWSLDTRVRRTIRQSGLEYNKKVSDKGSKKLPVQQIAQHMTGAKHSAFRQSSTNRNCSTDSLIYSHKMYKAQKCQYFAKYSSGNILLYRQNKQETIN